MMDLLLQKAILDSADYSIISTTPEGIITTFNGAAHRWLGYCAEEVIGKLTPEIFHDLEEMSWRARELSKELNVSIQPGFEVLTARASRGPPDESEWTYIRKDGSRFPVLLSVTALRVEDNSVRGFLCIAGDITKRKQAEDQLRRLSRAVEQSPVSVIITDTLGNIEYVNPKFTQVTGYSPEEVLGYNPRVLKSGEKSPEEYKVMWETITSGEEWRGFFHNRKKSGELYWESASISPIKNSSGVITHFIAVKEDITALKRAEEELDKLSLVASKTDNAVIITDSEGCIEWVNEAFVRLTGYTLRDVIFEKPGHILQGPLSDPATVERIGRCLGAAKPFTEEIVNYHKDGHAYWVSMNITPLFNERGEVVRFISIENDITQRKKIEEALRQAKDAADAANQAKTEFLAGMSHEIRTPLNAIMGVGELLAETPLNAEQRRYVDVLNIAGESLLRIINDILDFSRVEAGRIQLENTPFDLVTFMDMICEMMAVQARQKGLELVCRITPDVPVHLVGDSGRLRQVLMNLMGNAVKFTQRGKVTVEVELGEEASAAACNEAGHKCSLRFSVTDTGIGVPPDKVDLIFERFSQADASIPRKYGGTGLGLAISMRLVELMGGRMWVERTVVGKGTTICFDAPFGVFTGVVDDLSSVPRRSDASLLLGAKGGVGAPNVPFFRILLVDDSSDNRLLVEAFLENSSYHVDEAENGRIAMEKFKSQKYDLVLMDMEMPIMDGYSATREIRDWERRNGVAPVPILAFTAYALQEEIRRMSQVGCTGHLSKPIKKDVLLEALATHIAGAETAKRTETSPGPIVRVDADLEDIIPEFLENRRKDVLTLSKAVEARDFEEIRVLGHTLKGVGGGFGFDLISEVGSAIETAAGEKNLSKALRLTQELSEYLHSLEVVYE